MKLGFIGLGNLGKAVAGRLLDCGHALTVWNRTPGQAENMDVAVVGSPAAVTEAADVIFLCMFNSDAVRTVLTQENGLLSGNISGKTIVDLTTNHFHDVVDFHTQCKDAGAEYIEAPVLGSVVPAANGMLTVLVSGNEATYDNVRPLLDNIGANIFYLGAPAQASKMKLINNMALGSYMATIAESLALAEDIGVAKANALDIMSTGGAKSLVLEAKKAKLLNEDFSTHFSSALIYKDLQCLQELAFEQKKTVFTAAVAKELFARTFEEGFEEEDLSAIYKLFKRK